MTKKEYGPDDWTSIAAFYIEGRGVVDWTFSKDEIRSVIENYIRQRILGSRLSTRDFQPSVKVSSKGIRGTMAHVGTHVTMQKVDPENMERILPTYTYTQSVVIRNGNQSGELFRHRQIPTKPPAYEIARFDIDDALREAFSDPQRLFRSSIDFLMEKQRIQVTGLRFNIEQEKLHATISGKPINSNGNKPIIPL